ncbi:sensor histidine kinase [Gracilibacillus lacisalsi]|uniref:sensor histidine kinase n=1 Tax=Gracilibacillus lacisalsi TaxID=393087 RepID=UPI00036B5CC5|nr:sensor histidine kinase [Gracilibacillus lacisalsi]
MNNKILIKNILLFVFPLFIPVFILGSFAIFITDKYMRESIQSNHTNVLQQIEQQTNTILNEMYLLNLDYNWNPEIILSLQNIFDADSFTYDQVKNANYQEGTIRRKEIATPYIQSIYIYYQNQNNRVLTSRYGITEVEEMPDAFWLQEFDETATTEDIWIKSREIPDYSFTKQEPVISVFRNVFKSNSQTSEGLIVLNIYQRYFSNLIKELNNYHHQSIFVLDENNHKLFGNSMSNSIDPEHFLLPSNRSTYEVTIDGTPYIVNQLASDNYGLRYFSLVEKAEIYMIPNQLRFLTLIFVLLSLMLGTTTIYYLTRKNARHVSDIISMLHTSNHDEEELIKNISFKDNEYQLIVRKLLKNFIAKKNLEMELHEKKYQFQEAELSALQNQINPHFLSNTLAIIYWRAMALTGKPNKVTQMLETLTDILDFSLRIKHHTVTLAEEIHHTKNYLTIIHIRSDHAFTIDWDYDERILHEQVLKFILQPIVENSVTHGCDDDKNIRIKIKIRKRADKIRFTIIDNGTGLSKERLKELLEEHDKDEYITNHIGLANIKKRISLLFNNQYQFIIRSKKGWGTVVVIEHPIP